MAFDRKAQLAEAIQGLLDQGKTPDEIRGMRAQLVASVGAAAGGAGAEEASAGSPTALGPDDQGPPTRGTEANWRATRPPPMSMLAAQDEARAAGAAARTAGAKGEGPGLLDTLKSLRPAMPSVDGTGMPDPTAEPIPERLAASNPELVQMQDELKGAKGAIAGIQVGGAAGKALGALAAPLTRGLTGVGGLLGRTATSTAAGGLSAVPASVATDLTTGNTEGMGERAVGSMLPGALLGGGTHLVGEALQGLGGAVTESRGGQARQLLERNGAQVSVTSPGEGGPFAPGGRLEGRQPTDVDIGRTSRESAVNILRRQADELAADLKPTLARKGDLDARGGGRRVDVAPLLEQARALAENEGLSPAEQATVRGWVGRLEAHGVRQPDGTVTGPFMMPAGGDRGLNAFRGMLDRATGRGTDPGAPPKAAMQGMAGAAKQIVDTTEYAPINEEIAGARGKFERGRTLLDLKKKPSGKSQQAPEAGAGENIPEQEVAKVANAMSRGEQNTVTAGLRNADRFRTFGEEFPQHRADVEAPRAVEARGDLSFKLRPDERGGLIARTGRMMGGGAAAYAIADLLPSLGVDPKMAAIMMASGTAGADLLRLNAPAIQGRLLYPGGQAARGLGGAMTDAAPQAGGMAPAVYDQLQALMARLDAERQQTKGKRP